MRREMKKQQLVRLVHYKSVQLVPTAYYKIYCYCLYSRLFLHAEYQYLTPWTSEILECQ